MATFCQRLNLTLDEVLRIPPYQPTKTTLQAEHIPYLHEHKAEDLKYPSFLPFSEHPPEVEDVITTLDKEPHAFLKRHSDRNAPDAVIRHDLKNLTNAVSARGTMGTFIMPLLQDILCDTGVTRICRMIGANVPAQVREEKKYPEVNVDHICQYGEPDGTEITYKNAAIIQAWPDNLPLPLYAVDWTYDHLEEGYHDLARYVRTLAMEYDVCEVVLYNYRSMLRFSWDPRGADSNGVRVQESSAPRLSVIKPLEQREYVRRFLLEALCGGLDYVSPDWMDKDMTAVCQNMQS